MPPTQEKEITISKKSPERWHQSKKSRSRSPKKSLYYHSGPKVSPEVAVNLSQQKSSLKTPDLPNGSISRSTILDPNTGRQPKISPHVPVNSSQNSSLEILASRFTILNPDKERLPEVSHEMQLSSLQENSSFNGGNSRSSEIHGNIGSTSPRVDISVEQKSPFYGKNVNFDPFATSCSSNDELVAKNKFAWIALNLQHLEQKLLQAHLMVIKRRKWHRLLALLIVVMNSDLWHH